jgi:2-oxoglutarate dehydrogenase E1 component
LKASYLYVCITEIFMDKFSYISNAHSGYIEGLYEAYRENPASLDIQWQKFFEGFDFASRFGQVSEAKDAGLNNRQPASPGFQEKELAVAALIEAYRQRGHFLANTNPVRKRKDRKPMLELADFGLSPADLQERFQACSLAGLPGATLDEVIVKLKKTYLGKIGFEVAYIRNSEQRAWLMKKIEEEWPSFSPSHQVKQRILRKLNEAVVFENFLHTKYVGQKRFSLEGGETAIPVLDFILSTGASASAEEFVIGMAHRGRLNVLANTMGKTYEQIFSEFEGNSVPDLTMGDGDVKYHLGYKSDQVTPDGKSLTP